MHAPDSVTVGGDSLIIHGVFAPLQGDSPRRRYVSPTQHLLQYNRPQAARGVCRLVSSQHQHHEPPNGVAQMCVVCVCACACALFLSAKMSMYAVPSLKHGAKVLLLRRLLYYVASTKKKIFSKKIHFLFACISVSCKEAPPVQHLFFQAGVGW